MTGISSLLIPILLSSVLVFVVSSILHMALPWHKKDYGKVSNEDQLRDAVRSLGIAPGDYMVPQASSREEMKSPEFAERFREGPTMMFTIFPTGSMNMARPLILWFIYIVVVTVFAAYVTGRALGPNAEVAEIYRFACTTAFLAYAGALWQNSIWYRRSPGTTLRSTIDGLIYGFLTAAALAWLWPGS
jgi:hypothetical protein